MIGTTRTQGCEAFLGWEIDDGSHEFILTVHAQPREGSYPTGTITIIDDSSYIDAQTLTDQGYEPLFYKHDVYG